ncbi:hypothetical protein EDB86DRAFT_228694 [Lactarius hatsudake]|nr:hypothetical protein EDB86DRAFT_228694 [Lactarius hatsudake]
MILFPILKIVPTSYNMSSLCRSKSVPLPPPCDVSPPLSPPRVKKSLMTGAAITFLRLPVLGYQMYMKIPDSVRPPRLLLLVLLLLLVALTVLLCILLVLLVLLTSVSMSITLLLFILLPPSTLNTVVLPIKNSVTQYLAQATKTCLPSPMLTLFSALSGLQQSLFKRGGPVVKQAAPNVVPFPSVFVAPPCPSSPPPPSPPLAQPRTLRRSKSWLRW